MNEEDLGFLPATELAPMIRQKQISPVEVMASIIKRIERLEPKINAMAAFGPELAMQHARTAEAALMKGAALGPVHGLPVTIKDLAWTTDFPTEAGSHSQKGFQAKIDNPFVARLRAAGAIVIGKTTTSEFGWTGVSRSPLTGITHNPWKQGYNAGASSADAGAAAAAGYSALHQGSDGAGSIRMPAHFCGLFGLKPTHGRVPNHPVGAGDYTSHIGPMTRTVGDGALMMQVMAGPHPLDHTSQEAWPADYIGRLDEGVRGRRVAFSMDLGHARVDPEVAELVRAAAEQFTAAAGLTMVDVKPAWGPTGAGLIRDFWSAHMTQRAALLPKFENQMDPGLVACIKSGQAVSMAQYQDMRNRKNAYIADIHMFFEDWDYLITPTVSVAAFPAERLMPAHWPQHEWDCCNGRSFPIRSTCRGIRPPPCRPASPRTACRSVCRSPASALTIWA